MQLDKHTRREKLLIKLRDERSKVWEEQRKNPYVPVTPYRWGWMVHAYLRSDALNRWDAPYMLEALKTCTEPYHTTDVKIVKAARGGSTKAKGKGVSKRKSRKISAEFRRRKKKEDWWRIDRPWTTQGTRDIIPQRRHISIEEWEKLPLHVQRCFGYSDWESKLYPWKKPYYVCSIPSYYIRARVEAYWVTRHHTINPELQSKDNWLRRQEEKLEYGGYCHWDWNYSTSYPRSKMRTETRTQIRKYLKGEVEDIEIPLSPREYDY